jgi:hypothetical protein
MTQYCLVTNNTITDGPRELPFEFENMTGFDKIDDPVIFNWYPYTSATPPTINATEKAVAVNTIADKSVVQSYVVSNLTADEISARTPREVSAAQAKVALFNAGLLDQASTEIAKAYKPIQIYWDSAPTFERNHPYIMGIGSLLGLSDTQVDSLFTAASIL